MKHLLNAAAAAAIFSFGTASAGTLTLTDLAGTPPTPEVTLSADGVDVTVSSATFVTDSFDVFANEGTGTITERGDLIFASDGLGVDNGLEDFFIFTDSNDVDGFMNQDLILFAFDQEVSLDAVGFDSFDGILPNEFVLFSGDSLSELSEFTEMSVAEQVSLGVVGQVFGIGARSFEDDFVLTSLTFDAVPIPAAAPLFAAGLGLGAVARRRKARG